jgi:competence protein ComEC
MYYDFLLIVVAIILGLVVRMGTSLGFIAYSIGMFIFLKCYFELDGVRFLRNLSIGLVIGWMSLWGFHNQLATLPMGEVVEYRMKVIQIDNVQGQALLAIEAGPSVEPRMRKPKIIYNYRYETDEFSTFISQAKVGQVLTLACSLLPLKPPTNPGESDFRKIYYGKMVMAEIGEIDRLETVSLPNHFDLLVVGSRIRNRLIQQMAVGLDPKYLGIAVGMGIGDKSLLTEEEERAMRKIGLSHILVVSSLHVGLLVVLLDKNMKRLKFPSVITEVAIISMLILLLIITVSKVSVAKCIFIYLAHLVGLKNNRKPFYIGSLALFAGIFLCWNPYLIYNLSFTLSLIAYIGVFYVYRYTDRPRQNFAEIWYLTFCIYIVIIPVLIRVFSGFHYMGLFISPLVMPFVEVLIGLNFANALIQYVGSLGFCSEIMNFLFGFMEMLLAISKRLGEGYLQIPYRTPSLLLVAYCLLALFCIKRKWFNKRLFYSWLGLGLITLIVTIGIHHYPMRVFFLDVGMGDGAVVYNGNTSVLIDGGTKYQKGKIKKVMAFLGERTIDYGILSHEHNDHYGAMFELMSENLIDRVYITPVAYEALMDKNECLSQYHKDQRLIFVTEDMKMDWFSQWEFQVIAPEIIDDNKNNHSIMCLLKKGPMDFLFTGDAEKEQETLLVDKISNQVSPPVEYLKVAHHGSVTSSSEIFLLAVHANYGIISVGQGNRYGLPDRQVVDRYTSMGTTLHRTDYAGCLEVRVFYPWTQTIQYKRD